MSTKLILFSCVFAAGYTTSMLSMEIAIAEAPSPKTELPSAQNSPTPSTPSLYAQLRSSPFSADVAAQILIYAADSTSTRAFFGGCLARAYKILNILKSATDDRAIW